MAQHKVLRPDWLPAVALSSALALLMLIWSPPVGDLAAQVFRTELFERAGHRDLERQLVRRPLHAHLQRPLPAAGGAARPAGGGAALGRLLLLPLRPPGPRPLGGRGALGDPLVRCRRRHPARRRPAHLRPRRRLRRSARCAACSRWRPRGRRARAASARRGRAPSASPVAGAFLAGVAGRRRRSNAGGAVNRVALGAAALALVLTVAPNLAFPESGQFPFALSSFIAIPLWCAGALILTDGLRGEERQLRRVILGYALASTVIWLVAECARRQRGPARRPLRRPGAGGGPALAAAAADRAALVLRRGPRRSR